MTGWFSPAEIAAASAGELPTDADAMSRHAARNGWRRDRRLARIAGQGGGWEYHYTLAPVEVQARLMPAPAEAAAPAPSKPLWALFERLSKKAKDEAAARLSAVDQVESLSPPATRTTAVTIVAHERGVSTSTLFGWLKLAAGVDRADRLAALAPQHAGRTATAECDPRAWDFIVADWMRAAEPAFAPVYRRMQDAAAEHGWSPIPALKTLQRRLEKEIPKAARMAARQGPEALAKLYPAQERTRTHLGPLQAVTMDGHKIDVFVRLPDHKQPVRVMLVALQDLGTGLIVGWNLDLSENAESVRLAIADMVEHFGIPDEIYLDNGRAFASKDISGRQPSRYRFKVKDDEPMGVLTQLGIRTHWTKPYSGQSKPIERAFLDLVEEIARHPRCAGAYTGNSPEAKPHDYGSRAMPFAELEALVEREIERHNAREGRRGLGINGRSFVQVWNDKIAAGAMVRRGSEEQRRMLLLAAEAVTIRRDKPAIHFEGNRYWAEFLVEHAGEKVTVRFDPGALWAPLAVYGQDGRFLGTADCIEQTGFDDREAARTHGRTRAAWLKAQRQAAELHQRLSQDELLRLIPAPAPSEPEQPKVIKLAAVANGRGPAPQVTDFSSAFSAGFDRLGEVLPFQRAGDD